MHTVGLFANLGTELQGVFDCTRWGEDCRMGDDPHEPAQYQFGDAIRSISVDNVFKPLAHGRMVGRVRAMSVDENIDVDQDHRCRSIIFNSAALSSRSTPGRGPLPRTVVS